MYIYIYKDTSIQQNINITHHHSHHLCIMSNAESSSMPSSSEDGQDGKGSSKRKLVWIPHTEHGWELVTLIGSKNGGKKAIVATKNGKKKVVKHPEKNVVRVVPSVLTNTYNNLAEMEDFSEGTILHHVKNRFLVEKHIYTYVGDVIVAVNPYQMLDIYGEKQLKYYIENVKDEAGNSDLIPHVYGVAGKAFKTLSVTGKSQSVLISGESGAGKTETTKKVLYFLAELIPSTATGGGTMMVKVLQMVYLLKRKSCLQILF